MPEIELRKLFVGNSNVRSAAGNITELTKSVREEGVLEPLLVRPAKGKFEIIAGRRRFHAAKAAGLKKVDCVVRRLTDEQAIVASLVENLQREDIEPEEEYDGYMKLQKLNSKLYGKYEQLAKATGKSLTHVQDVFEGVEFTRKLRQESKAKVEVRLSPSKEERESGNVLPLEHAKLMKGAQASPTVKQLPPKERGEKLVELSKEIAPLPREKARLVIDKFKQAPDKPVPEIVEMALAKETGIHVHVYLAPRIASALSKAAEERGMTEEELIPVAVEEWLKQVGYSV